MGCDGLSLYACSAHARSCRSFTWRAPLKGSSRVLVRAAIHKGEFLDLLACSALAKWVHDAHLEGISDVIEPSDSKICSPLTVTCGQYDTALAIKRWCRECVHIPLCFRYL